MLYRVKQFYWAITCSFKKPNYEWIQTYLNEQELNLFNKLSIEEQFHCVRVAKNSLIYAEKKYNLSKSEIDELVKICLLHDIGKIGYEINVIEKSILVILGKLFSDKLRSLVNTSDKVRAYYYHGDYGADMLKDKGYSDNIVYVIRNHHKKVDSKNKFLQILKHSDDIS